MPHDKSKWTDCENTVVPAVTCVLIFLVCTSLLWVFICPWHFQFFPWEICIPVLAAFGCTTLFTFVNFSYASFSNPGFLTKTYDHAYAKRQSSVVVVNGIGLNLKFCRTCNYFRMPRTVHCSQCDHCIDNFDHHCPWVNNCVGRRNYRYFFGFLCCLATHILVSIGITVTYIWKQDVMTWDTPYIISVVVTLVSGLIFVPVVGLLCFHLYLIAIGMTTYEFVTKKYNGKSPFNINPCYNCVFQLCGPEFPVLQPRSQPASEDDSDQVAQSEFLSTMKNTMSHHNHSFPTDRAVKTNENAIGGEGRLSRGDTTIDNNNNVDLSNREKPEETQERLSTFHNQNVVSKEEKDVNVCTEQTQTSQHIVIDVAPGTEVTTEVESLNKADGNPSFSTLGDLAGQIDGGGDIVQWEDGTSMAFKSDSYIIL